VISTAARLWQPWQYPRVSALEIRRIFNVPSRSDVGDGLAWLTSWLSLLS
jgi:hypothetical protein